MLLAIHIGGANRPLLCPINITNNQQQPTPLTQSVAVVAIAIMKWGCCHRAIQENHVRAVIIGIARLRQAIQEFGFSTAKLFDQRR